jgi:tripartite-type tricarboxylate transporter receptor subunit TctC
LRRRRLIQTALLGGGGIALQLLGARLARAASPYPDHAVRLIIGNSAGSAADTVARSVARRLSDLWGQPIVADNRTGAGGVIAADAVAKSQADGYTLLLGQEGALSILPALHQKMPLDPQKDLEAVVALAEADLVLVANPKNGFRSLSDLIAEARKHPGKLSYASAGNGSLHHLAFELLKNRAGIDLIHVPYKGGPLGLNDVVAGQVDVMFIAAAPAIGHIQAGKLTALATGGTQRHPMLPAVPTVAESYPGFRATTWYALFAPAGTPRAVIDRIARDATQALHAPELHDALLAQGITPLGGASTELAQLVRNDTIAFAELAKQVRLEIN